MCTRTRIERDGTARSAARGRDGGKTMLIAVTTTSGPSPVRIEVIKKSWRPWNTELEEKARLAAYRHVYYGESCSTSLQDQQDDSRYTEVIRPSEIITLKESR